MDNNPLFAPRTRAGVNMREIQAPTVHRARLNLARRLIRNARRVEAAAEAIRGFDRDTEIFGFTKGQWSLVELVGAVLDIIGPARFGCCTWTIASYDLTCLGSWASAGKIHGCRFLVDRTFQRRSPEQAAKVRSLFGGDALRILDNHAKFVVLRNDEWDVVIRTSMNLNPNPRFENFTLSHDPPLADFLDAILDEIWEKQDSDFIDTARPFEAVKWFKENA